MTNTFHFVRKVTYPQFEGTPVTNNNIFQTFLVRLIITNKKIRWIL